MASVFDIVKESIESTHVATCDIYGGNSVNPAKQNFNEAVNEELKRIANQEETFKELAQKRENTPLTDKIQSYVTVERNRVSSVEKEPME